MTDETPVDVEDLLRNIRGQFYGDLPEKRYHQDRTVLVMAVTWGANWLKERGVSWTTDRYFQTLRDLLLEIKRHGATAEIRWFPGYLLKCVQDHFAHNSDTYCDEGKKALHAWERALGKATASAQADAARQDEQKIEVLAQAYRVLAVRRKPTKAPLINDPQGSLF
jgi:hypothetical protein